MSHTEKAAACGGDSTRVPFLPIEGPQVACGRETGRPDSVCPFAFYELERRDRMTHYRRLAGATCYLSPRSDSDTELFKKWDNDLDVILQASMNGHSTPATLIYQDPARAKEMLKHMFVIVEAQADHPIGWCSLFVRIPENRRAMLAIMIGEKEYWGRGYGQEAVALLLDYGFSILNLNSVELGVFAFNERAIRCYERVGFRRVGMTRESRIVGGEKHDTVLMDILASEFEGPAVRASLRDSQGRTARSAD